MRRLFQDRHLMTTARPHQPPRLGPTRQGGDSVAHVQEGCGTEAEEPWAPRCPAQTPARHPGDPLPCQASFPRQPRTQPAGQQRRRKRKSQGSEVTSRTQTRQSRLSHAQPRATRLNVRHRWSRSLRPGPMGPCAAGHTGLPLPRTCPSGAATPWLGSQSPACAPQHQQARAVPRACCRTGCTRHPAKPRAGSLCQLGQRDSASSCIRYRKVTGTCPVLEQALGQSPCPSAGVPSHRTGILLLFGKPGFINTPRSCLRSPTPCLSHSMGSPSPRKRGTAPRSPSTDPAPQTQPARAERGQPPWRWWEPAAHRGGCSPWASHPSLPGSAAAAWGRGAAAGLNREARKPLVTSPFGPSMRV